MTLTSKQQAALADSHAFLTQLEQPVFLPASAADGTGRAMAQSGAAGPTGRAARVMTQQTGREAATVHRDIYDFMRRLALPAGQPSKGRDADKTIKYHFDLAAN